MATLEEVLRHYGRGGRARGPHTSSLLAGFRLTERERAENETAISEAVSFAFEFVQAKVAMRARR
jgi:hypothetical protein